MKTAIDCYKEAISHINLENFDKAKISLLEALIYDPNHLQTLELLADFYSINSEHQSACNYLQLATSIDDKNPKLEFNLANSFFACGDFSNSIVHYQKSIKLDPRHLEPWLNLGRAQSQSGDNKAAIDTLLKASEVFPKSEIIFFNIGILFFIKNDFETSLIFYKKALEISPNSPKVLNNYGLTLSELNRHVDALPIYEKALELQPNYEDALNNYGTALCSLMRYEEALKVYAQVLKINPNYSSALSNYGLTLMKMNRHKEALNFHKKALEISPNSPKALNNYGLTLSELNRHVDALPIYEKALELQPNYEDALNNYGTALCSLMRYEEALKVYEQVLKINPNYPYILGKIIFIELTICNWSRLNTHIKILMGKINLNENALIDPFTILLISDSPQLIQKVAANFQKINCVSVHRLEASASKNSRIKIGYFSPDFRNHAVSYLIADLLKKHDRNVFEIYAFSFSQGIRDSTSNIIRENADHFYDIQNLSDAEVLELSHSLNIDIAVDLCGFTKNNRFKLFNYGLSRIQINFLGYPGTMGSNNYQYIFGDSVITPPEESSFYNEKIIYLNNTYQPNSRIVKSKDDGQENVEITSKEDVFTYCCFNNSFKITEIFFNCWMRVLQKVPKSVLVLLEDNSIAAANLTLKASAFGINKDRIIFYPRTTHDLHLLRHRNIDLFLDTSPYGAHTTASDALKMGVPVLTVYGNTFSSRVSSSLLRCLNLNELIASDISNYEFLAVTMGSDKNYFSLIKNKLSSNLESYPVFNMDAYISDYEAKLIEISL